MARDERPRNHDDRDEDHDRNATVGGDGVPRVANEASRSSESPEARELRASKGELRTELSRMISDLNEVRMRLDSVVRKFAEPPAEPRMATDDESARERSEVTERVEELRVELAKQLDRIRHKLVSRMPEEP